MESSPTDPRLYPSPPTDDSGFSHPVINSTVHHPPPSTLHRQRPRPYWHPLRHRCRRSLGALSVFGTCSDLLDARRNQRSQQQQWAAGGASWGSVGQLEIPPTGGLGTYIGRRKSSMVRPLVDGCVTVSSVNEGMDWNWTVVLVLRATFQVAHGSWEDDGCTLSFS